MISGLSILGALPKPAGNPSPRGAEGGRLFLSELAGALRKPLENPIRQTQASQKLNEYAAFFVEQMMQSMRQTVMQSGLCDGGRAEKAFQGMMDQKLSVKLADSLKFDRAFGNALKRLDRQDAAKVEVSSIQA